MPVDLTEDTEQEQEQDERQGYRPALQDNLPDYTGGRPVAAPAPDRVPMQPMGNAWQEPSQTGKDLGQFAEATGTAKPVQTPLQKVGPAPTPPDANPELATTEADLRAHAAPTVKYDPATGKTLDKYHPGMGSRIGRAFLDFARGGVPEALEGAFGDRSAPGYYGSGAVNSQYFRDEWARKQAEGADQAKIDSLSREDATAQRDFRNKEASYKDETRNAYEQTTTAERARHQKETEDLTQQLRDTQQQSADIKQQLADAKDPVTKMQAEMQARRTIAKSFPRLKGQALDDYVMFGDKAAMIGIDRVRINLEEQKIGLERDRLNRTRKEVNDYGYTSDEQRGINIQAPGAIKQLNDLSTQRAVNIAAGVDTSKLDAEIEKVKGTIKTAAETVKGGRPTSGAKPGPGRNAPNTPNAPTGLTPVQATSMKTPGGNTVKIGDKNPRTGQVVKGFAEDKQGVRHATY